jgi:hypothetical protein
MLAVVSADAGQRGGKRPPAPAAVKRPAGIQVWTSQPPKPLTAFDVAPAGAKPAIKLVGVRGARFSGRIVLASGAAIRGVRVQAGDLSAAGGKGKIAAARIRVRYAMPGEYRRKNLSVPECRFDALLEQPPAEVPVRTSVRSGTGWRSPKRNAGAMLPVWITVQVPPDAAASTYSGAVTVSAQGLAATKVPLSIKVHAWTMPKLEQWTCRNNIWQSHESSALRYKVPLWSEKHFELMGRVLELTRPIGNGFCTVHLISGAYHQGNGQGMVRWVKHNGGYKHDFSTLERYLELYEKKLGKPRIILLSAFHPYVVPKKKGQEIRSANVSLAAASGGEVTNLRAPNYGTPESVKFWKPVLNGVFERIRKRGWMDAVVIGTASDNGPRSPEPYDMFTAIWPQCRIMFSGHPCPRRFMTSRKVKVPVTVREHVWGAGRLRKQYPWPVVVKQAGGTFAFSRAGAGMCHLRQDRTLAAHRANPEMCLQCGQNGIGRVGADYWKLPGRETPLSGSSGAHIGPSASVTNFTEAGPKGPVGTTRLEMLAEGMQTREALGFLLSGLKSGRIGGALAGKCKTYLDARAAGHLKHQPKKYNLERGLPYQENWQAEEEKLFALCAEAARAMGLR